MSTYAKILAAGIGTLLIALSVFNALEGVQGDESYLILEWLIGPGVFLFLFALSYHANTNAIKRGTLTRSVLVQLYAAFLCAAGLAYWITWRCHVPSDVRVEFDNSQKETQASVQLRFWQDGRWLDGPLVDGFPLQVSFPDLNGDGHHDIRITHISGDAGNIEFIYLPSNDGHVFWRLLDTEYQGCVRYPAAGLWGSP